MVKSCAGNKINNLLSLFQKDEFLTLNQKNFFNNRRNILVN